MADEKWETSEALQFARRAVELGPEDAIALSTGGFGLAYLGGELDDGTTFIDRAIELSPNLASGFIFSGWTRILLGDQETAIKHFKHSMRFSPLDPFIMSSYSGSLLRIFSWETLAKLPLWRKRLFACSRNTSSLVWSAQPPMLSAGIWIGRDQAIARVRAVDPTFRVSNLMALEPLRNQEQLAIWAEGMRKAGLPE